jgi:hypothetical protein
MDDADVDDADARPADTLRDLVLGYRVSQALHAAATLGLADLLAAGPATSDELAGRTQTHPDALYRLLRALASAGVFEEREGRRFALTPVGECLRSDVEGSVAGLAVFVGRPYFWEVWGNLLHSVRTGENAFRHVHGLNNWQYRAQHPEEEVIFDQAMVSNARRVTGGLLAAYDFARFGTVVDVGGGRGALLAALLRQYPALRGVLFDQPQVVAHAVPLLEAAGVSGRCRILGGSFFGALPPGGDAYLLKSVLHDWEDAEATAILRRCREAMGPGAALLVIEFELGEPNAQPLVKFSDLNMLVGPGGRERSLAEFGALFRASDFELVGATVSAGGPSIIEAVPV